MHRLPPQRGLTLLESLLTLALLGLMVVGLADSIRDNARQVGALENRRENHLSLGRVTSQVTQEVMASSWGLDAQGVPYLLVLDNDDDQGSILEFRTLDRFTVDGVHNTVIPGFSTPIRLFVDAEGQFVRSQDGSERVLGTGFRAVHFSIEPNAAVRLDVELEAPVPTALSPGASMRISPLNSNGPSYGVWDSAPGL